MEGYRSGAQAKPHASKERALEPAAGRNRRIRPDLGLLLVVGTTQPEEEREARADGVLFYGAREGWRDIVQVLRQSLTRPKNVPLNQQLVGIGGTVAPDVGGGVH